MSEQWGGSRSAMEGAQERAEPTAEQQMAGHRLYLEFANAYPAWRDHPGLQAAAVKVAQRAQEAGEDLGLVDEKVGHLNRAEFYADVAAELATEHSLSGDLRKLQGRRR